MTARRRVLLAILVAMIAALARGGVGAWTTNGPGGRWYHVASDSGLRGVVYTETARSTNDGASWAPTDFGAYVPVDLAVGAEGKVFVSAYLPDSAAVFASEDAGVHWVRVVSRPTPSSPQVFAAWFESMYGDPRDARVLYAQFSLMVRELRGTSRRATFERSTDGGLTWQVTGLPSNGLNFVITSVAIDPADPDVLMVAVNDLDTGFVDYRSVDAGASWEQVETSEPASEFVFDPHSPHTVYAAGLSGLRKSTDSGASFVNVASTLPVISRLLVSPANPERLFALSTGRVFSSSDGGVSWTPLDDGLRGRALNGLTVDATGRFLHAPDVAGAVYDYQLVEPLVLNAAHPFTIGLTANDPRTGRVGAGIATPVNDLWGYFSLPAITGNPNNPEVFVKMLDGTALNGSYWFFYGGLTNLQYALTVTEDATGKQKTYTNPAGSECGGSDIAAFTP